MKRFEHIFEHAKIGIAICNANSRRLEMVNPAFAHIHGYEPHELKGCLAAEMFSPQCSFRRSGDDCTKGSGCFCEDTTFETVHTRKDGSKVPVSVHIAVIKDNNGAVEYRIINLIDISKRKEIENQLILTTQRITSLFNTIPDLIWLKDPHGVYLTCNYAFEQFFGFTEAELIGKTDYDITNHTMADLFRKNDNEAIIKGNIHINEETLISRSTGIMTTLLTRKAPVYSPDKTLLGVLGIAKDITENKKSERKIDELLYHDLLTHLPNRAYAKEETEKILSACKNNSREAALILIDLDAFKEVNKTFGHALGDALLRATAHKLKKQLRSSDTLCRLGGDEFLFILPGLKQRMEPEKILQRIFEEFETPFPVEEHLFSVCMSAGIAIYPVHGTSFDTLLQRADTALYHAKEEGQNNFCFFDEKMNHNLGSHFNILNNLKSAHSQNQFLLYYQPQIDLNATVVVGVEALLRWNHPTMGMIPPTEFIPIAETSSLIIPIGTWILQEACRQGAYWHAAGMKMRIAVNISAVQFRRGDLEESIKNALDASGFDPTYLELELTESIMMNDTQKTLETVARLKSLGITLSIDDFGTGYSSLAYLKRFAVDRLKIDRSFIMDIIEDQEDAVIVKTIIEMAKNLNLTTIAEGVEESQTLELLRLYGCDEIQGYHFSKPLHPNDIETFFHRFHKEYSMPEHSSTS